MFADVDLQNFKSDTAKTTLVRLRVYDVAKMEIIRLIQPRGQERCSVDMSTPLIRPLPISEDRDQNFPRVTNQTQPFSS
jgi:hypothetical protein